MVSGCLQALQALFTIKCRQLEKKDTTAEVDSHPSIDQLPPATPSQSLEFKSGSFKAPFGSQTSSTSTSNSSPSLQSSSCDPLQAAAADSAAAEASHTPQKEPTDAPSQAESLPGPRTPERETEPPRHSKPTCCNVKGHESSACPHRASNDSLQAGQPNENRLGAQPEEGFYSPLMCGARLHRQANPSSDSMTATGSTEVTLPEVAISIDSKPSQRLQSQESSQPSSCTRWWERNQLADAPFPPEFRDPKVEFLSSDPAEAAFWIRYT